MNSNQQGTAVAGSTGRYTLDECIGRGGVGEVFRGRDLQLERRVAIKRLHRDSDPQLVAGAIREARHLAALQHPNIVTVYDFVEDGGDILVVMELLRGETLQQIAERGWLSEDDCRSVMRQTLEGLIAAHSIGMLHRDIKPGNLMLVGLPSGGFQVKILDFGLAKIAEAPSLQTTDVGGGVLGSVHTMSPEQFNGIPLDGRSDLYSLGCVAYFSLAGRYPCTGQTVPEVIAAHLQQRIPPLEQIRPGLPPALVGWVMRMMSVHPDDRPGSAAEALDELDELSRAGAAPRGAAPVLMIEKAPARKAPVFGWVMAGIALAVLAAGGSILLKRRGAEGDSEPTGSVAASVAALESGPSRPESAATADVVTGASPTPQSARVATVEAGIGEGVLAPGDRAALMARVGQVVSVEGTIGRLGVNRTETIRFLNFQGSQKGDLSLVFFVKTAPDQYTEAGLGEYIGKRVRVRGEVTLYEGNPQIVIDSLAQLTVL